MSHFTFRKIQHFLLVGFVWLFSVSIIHAGHFDWDYVNHSITEDLWTFELCSDARVKNTLYEHLNCWTLPVKSSFRLKDMTFKRLSGNYEKPRESCFDNGFDKPWSQLGRGNPNYINERVGLLKSDGDFAIYLYTYQPYFYLHGSLNWENSNFQWHRIRLAHESAGWWSHAKVLPPYNQRYNSYSARRDEIYSSKTKLCFINTDGTAAMSVSINPHTDIEYTYTPPKIKEFGITKGIWNSDGAKKFLRGTDIASEVHDINLGESIVLSTLCEDADENAGDGFFYYKSPDNDYWMLLPEPEEKVHPYEERHLRNLNYAAFMLVYTPKAYGEYRFKVVVKDESGLEVGVEWPLVQVHGGPDRPIVQVFPEEPLEGQSIAITIPFHDRNGDLKGYDIQCFGVLKGPNPERILVFSEQRTLPGVGPRSIYDHAFQREFTDDGRFDHYEILAQAWDLKEQASERINFIIAPKPLPPSYLSEEEIVNLLIDTYPDLFEKDTAFFEWKVNKALSGNDLDVRFAFVDAEGLPLTVFFEKTLSLSGDRFVEETDAHPYFKIHNGGLSALLDCELIAPEWANPIQWRVEVFPDARVEIEKVDAPLAVRVLTEGHILIKENALVKSGRSIQLGCQNFANLGILEAPRITLEAPSVKNEARMIASSLDLKAASCENTGWIGPRILPGTLLEDAPTMENGEVVLKVGEIKNSGNIYGSVLRIDCSESAQNDASGLFQGDLSVKIEGSGKLLNAGKISSTRHLELKNHSLENFGLIAANEHIAIYNQSKRAENSGSIESSTGRLTIATASHFKNLAGGKLIAKDLSIDELEFYNSATIKILGTAEVSVNRLENTASGVIRDGDFHFKKCGIFINNGQFQPYTSDGELLPLVGTGTASIGHFDWQTGSQWTIENTLTCREKCSLRVGGNLINRGNLFAMSEKCNNQDVCTDESEFHIFASQKFENTKDAIIAATGKLTIESKGLFENQGKMNSKNELILDCAGDFVNQGSIHGLGKIFIQNAHDIINHKEGEIIAAGQWHSKNSDLFENYGTIKTQSASSIHSGSLLNTGLIDFHEGSALKSGALTNGPNGIFQLAANSHVEVENHLENEGSIRVAEGTILQAKSLQNLGAAAQIFGSSDFSIILEDDLENIGAEIMALGLLWIEAKKIINQRESEDGKALSTGQFALARIIANQLEVAAEHLLNQASIFYAYKDVSLKIGFIQNEGIKNIGWYKTQEYCKKEKFLGITVGKSCWGGDWYSRVDAIFQAALAAGGDIVSVLTNQTWRNGSFKGAAAGVSNQDGQIIAGKKLVFTEKDIEGIIEFYNGLCVNPADKPFSINLNRLYKGDALHLTLTDPNGEPLSSKYLNPETNSEFAYVSTFIQGVDDMIRKGIITAEYAYARPSAFVSDERSASILRFIKNPEKIRFFLDPVLEAHSLQGEIILSFGMPNIVPGADNMIEQSRSFTVSGFQEAFQGGIPQLSFSDRGLLESGKTDDEIDDSNPHTGLMTIGDLEVADGVWVVPQTAIDMPTNPFKYYTLKLLNTTTGEFLEEESIQRLEEMAKHQLPSAPFDENNLFDLLAPAGYEWVWAPVFVIPAKFAGNRYVTTDLISSGEGTFMDTPHAEFKNFGSFVSDGPIELKVASFLNEKPVFFMDQTVSGKGIFGKSFSQTYELRIPQPGGEVIGVDIIIDSKELVENVGGKIEAIQKVQIFSQKGDIRHVAQEYSKLDILDVGTLGMMMGRNPAVLHRYLNPAQIIGLDQVDLTSENGKIILIASRVLAGDIHFKSKKNLEIKSESIVTKSEDKSSFRGLKSRHDYKESYEIYVTQLLAENDIELASTDGSVILKGAHVMAGGNIDLKAKEDILLAPEIITRTFSSSTSGLTGLSFGRAKTSGKTKEIAETILQAGKNITLDADQDEILEAAFLHANELIYIRAKRDNKIQGSEESLSTSTSGWSVGIDFFGASFLNSILKNDPTTASELIMKLANEDPLIASFDALTKARGLMNLSAQGVLAAVQVYKALYVANKVKMGELTARGAIGQRLGITDANGDFDPRITLSLNVFKNKTESKTIIGSVLQSEDIKIISDRDTHLIDGSSLSAIRNVTIEAGRNLHVEAALDTSSQSGQNLGGMISFGGGMVPGVGINGNRYDGNSKIHRNANVLAQNILITVAEDLTARGANIEGDRVILTAKNITLESPLDEAHMHSIGGSIDTLGNISFQKMKEHTQKVGEQTHVLGTYVLSVNADELTLIGASLSAPEEGLKVKADTLVAKAVEEYSKKRGFGFSASIPFDRTGDVTQGDGILGLFDGFFLKEDSSGIANPTIPEGTIEIENGIPDTLNRDPSAAHIQTGHKKTYIRIAFPIIGEGFRKSWDEIRENLLSDKQNPATIDEITASLENWLEEKLSEEDVTYEGDGHLESENSESIADEAIAFDDFIHQEGEIFEVEGSTRPTSALDSGESWAGAVVEYGLDDEDATPLFSRNDFVDEATGATFKQLNLFAGEAFAEEDFDDDTELSVHFDAARGVIFFAHSLVDEKILIEADHERLLVAPDATWDRLASSLNIFKDDLKEFVNIYQEVLVASISSGVGFVPFVGDVKDIHDAIRGEDTFTGEKLSLFERALAGSLGITCLAANSCTEGTAGTGIRAVVQGLKSAQKAHEIQKALHSEAEILRSAERIKRFQEIREKGHLGEIAAGIPQGVKKEFIEIPGTLRRRYPDFVNQKMLIEVKNVKYQGLSSQLKDYIKFARQKNIPIILHIRQETRLSKPLIEAIKENNIQIEYLRL